MKTITKPVKGGHRFATFTAGMKKDNIEILLSKENLDLEDVINIRKQMLSSIKIRREVEKILAGFDTAKTRFSSQAKVISRKGVLYWMLDDVKMAISCLEQGSETEENNCILGLCYLETGRNEEAYKLLEKAYKLSPDVSYIFSAYVESLIKTGGIEPALLLLRKVKNEFKGEPIIPYCQGLCYEELREYEKSLDEYNKALSLDPEYAPAIFRLAYRYDLMGKEDEAVELYEKIRGIKPPYINALINLGLIYEDRCDYQKAIECYETVLSIHPEHPRARLYKEDSTASQVMYYDDSLKRKEAELKRLLSQPLSEFQLPTRARNCLEEQKINTIGELVRKTESELLSRENLGTKTLKDIKDLLARRGLALSTEQKPVTVESLLKSYTSPEVPKVMDILNKPIFEIDWSARVRASLTKMKVYTFGDLANKAEDDFQGLPNFGQTSLNEIKQRLSQHGLSLKAAE
ncbi:MAG: DNA-directed RNA polymerase subunit alpha C-terminal domain-containing protein [Planctomycetota bacterium]|nr:DNA-directed RNA polymerase subunit alpha C-terminal domain-containing protein [Planctomycetota bacterium]MDI6788014.1 DNA-directed RNA polymerase subunit alpha C-terminal domain-containing protein [Planctomycetota bacterium]